MNVINGFVLDIELIFSMVIQNCGWIMSCFFCVAMTVNLKHLSKSPQQGKNLFWIFFHAPSVHTILDSGSFLGSRHFRRFFPAFDKELPGLDRKKYFFQNASLMWPTVHSREFGTVRVLPCFCLFHAEKFTQSHPTAESMKVKQFLTKKLNVLLKSK